MRNQLKLFLRSIDKSTKIKLQVSHTQSNQIMNLRLGIDSQKEDNIDSSESKLVAEAKDEILNL